jgi:hypothetical protein
MIHWIVRNFGFSTDMSIWKVIFNGAKMGLVILVIRGLIKLI